MQTIIISRHAATIAWLREQPGLAEAPILAQATADDVRGKRVIGNLPLFLAAAAAEIVAVEFGGTPPRGAEYGREELLAAGVRLRAYRVFSAETAWSCPECRTPLRESPER